jgi:dTDP-4-dehydrorhamnose reductase
MGCMAVVGSAGQMGSDLVRALREALGDGQVLPLGHRDVEVTDAASVRRALAPARPDVVFNCAAWVRVDDAEDQPGQALRVNALGALNVARVCAELGALCVYISTDYVFDGTKGAPYAEDDPPRPLNVYGASKLAGEHLVRAACPRHLVVRTSGLYGAAGSSGKGGNFIEAMIRLAREGRPLRVVQDQVVSPTYTRDLARRIVELAAAAPPGIYHATNAGACSWYEFAAAVFRFLGMEPGLGPTTTEAYGARARRPRNSVLSSGKLAGLGLAPLRPWPEALRAYLRERGYLGGGPEAEAAGPVSRAVAPADTRAGRLP